jgi:Domain of unknown function (DUF1996)
MRKSLLLSVLVCGLVLGVVAAAFAKNGANFGNTCDVVGHSTADPIYEPNRGHPHVFYGAANVTNDDTSGTLRGRDTSCRRVENASAYWHPEVYRNGNALPVYTGKVRGDNTIYYDAGRIERQRSIASFPADFEMVARDGNGLGDVEWGCGGGAPSDRVPKTCNSKKLLVHIAFPQCWNKNLVGDAANKPERVVDPADGRCRRGWQPLPKITMSLSFNLPSTRVGNITVAGDGPGMRSPVGSMHADFVNGWQMNELRKLVDGCIRNVPDNITVNQKPDYCQDPGRKGLVGR